MIDMIAPNGPATCERVDNSFSSALFRRFCCFFDRQRFGIASRSPER
jgi:hypothetical protein